MSPSPEALQLARMIKGSPGVAGTVAATAPEAVTAALQSARAREVGERAREKEHRKEERARAHLLRQEERARNHELTRARRALERERRARALAKEAKRFEPDGGRPWRSLRNHQRFCQLLASEGWSLATRYRLPNPYRVTCQNGHGLWVQPEEAMAAGALYCGDCAHDVARAQEVLVLANFEALAIEAGATVLRMPYRPYDRATVRCANGHERQIVPAQALGKRRACVECPSLHPVRAFDHFYVVTSDNALKFGISNVPTMRLAKHRADGYTTVVRLVATGDAMGLEDSVLRTLFLARMSPVQGREYFSLRAMATVLDVVDNWPTTITTGEMAPEPEAAGRIRRLRGVGVTASDIVKILVADEVPSPACAHWTAALVEAICGPVTVADPHAPAERSA